MPVPSRLESGLASGCPKAVTAWMPLEKGPVSRASVIPVPPLASVLVCPALSRVPDWVLPEMETELGTSFPLIHTVERVGH
ncbi:hypothetical protein CFAM422_002691 [Trichoderma lentiforme]|uniref:Uncharacterized protein n=1 Tax=Trichoderma lentiforme TaxID=1567552 RepID=A0A9P5CHT2_9HYPO|nr:hypothetical protein CFAM422_002691 [Trichoderma lentiforme]